MKKSSILIFLLSLLLFSCTKESFSLSSSLLYRNISVSDGMREEEAVLSLSLSSAKDDESYSFLLVSPSGELRWEGGLVKRDGLYYSDALGLTRGARFEEGEYSLYIYSSSGTTLSVTVPLRKEEGDYTFESALRKDDVSVVYYDREGFVVGEDEESDFAVVTYSDRYSNRITLRVEFNT